MSIHDLKSRMADVAGIESLTMSLEAGRISLRWDGYSAAVDAAASDAEIEAAIRNAIKLPPVSLISEKPEATAAPAKANGASSMSANPASVGLSIQSVMESHVKQLAEIQETQLRLLETSLARQRETILTGVSKIADRIDGQTDDFEAIMRQFGN